MMHAPILSVTDFTERVKTLLENHVGSCWLRGEVSNFRQQASGHCYFSLKDAFTQVPAVLFRRAALRLAVGLRDGQQVVVHGRVSVYEPRGAYQIIVDKLLLEGQGQLQAQFEQLKQKLDKEGLFAAERKKPLPRLPRTVGIITSSTGAALRDFISILKRRHWRGRLVVLPAKVQGEGAAVEVEAMLRAASQLGFIDLLVISRGGGSLEDLWPFNDEALARAIAACPLPVISAVGHEIDFTLSDFVADQRAETPSAAAELISSHFLAMGERLAHASQSLYNSIAVRLDQYQARIRLAAIRLQVNLPARRVEHLTLRLDDLWNRLYAAWCSYLTQQRERLHRQATRLAACSPEGRLQLARAQVEHLAERLALADPQNTLKRGFVLVKGPHGRLLNRRSAVVPGTVLTTVFYDGELRVRSER